MNEKQREAVEAIEGPVMVMAGPGTGKTQVLAMRIAQILEKTDTEAGSVLALTFSDAGARAMRERLLDLIGVTAYEVNVETFHGYCTRIIAQNQEKFLIAPNPKPLSELERYEVIKKILEKDSFEYLKPAGDIYYYVRAIVSSIADLKREGVGVVKYEKLIGEEKDILENLIEESKSSNRGMKGRIAEMEKKVNKNKELLVLYGKYQQDLITRSRFDFEDMINFVTSALEKDEELRLIVQEGVQYLLVDEYQDTNNAQNKLVELLTDFWGEKANVFVVGDPKQSIYRFQGASLENVNWFKRKFLNAQIIGLKENYRSTQKILDSAYGVMKEDVIRSVGEVGNNVRVVECRDNLSEDYFVAKEIKRLIDGGEKPSEISVIYRNNKDAEGVAKMCLSMGVNISVVGGEDVLTDGVVRQLINMIRTIQSIKLGKEAVDLFTILNYPYIAEKGALALTRRANQEGVKLFDILPEKEIKQKIKRWIRREATSTLPELVSEIILESGLLAYAENLPEKLLKINRLRTFIEFANEVFEEKPGADLAELLRQIELMRENKLKLAEKEMGEASDCVRLTTAHGAKGLEWNHVFLYKVLNKKWGNVTERQLIKLPEGILKFNEEEDKNADERRLFFVALTRARKSVTISYNGEEGNLPSQFVEEIPENLREKLIVEETESQLADSLTALVLPTPEPKIDNDGLLDGIINDFCLSATGLNQYLECHYRFLLESLIRVPEIPTTALAFGSAVHKALEVAGKKPGLATLLSVFEKYFSQAVVPEAEKKHRLVMGKKMLEAYWKEAGGELGKGVAFEKRLGGKEVGLIGKMDRVEIIEGRKVRVVDYKTGMAKSLGEIEGTTANSEGQLKRQMVFYKILAEADKSFPYKVAETVLDFVESPYRVNKWIKRTVVPTEKDVEEVKTLIEETKKNIKNKQFERTTNRDICEKCPFNEHCWPEA